MKTTTMRNIFNNSSSLHQIILMQDRVIAEQSEIIMKLVNESTEQENMINVMMREHNE